MKTYKFTHQFRSAVLEVQSPNLEYTKRMLINMGLDVASWKCETPDRTVEFVYNKGDYSVPTWRTVEVIEENSDYIHGIEDGNFKKFLKSRIVGGKIIEVKN